MDSGEDGEVFLPENGPKRRQTLFGKVDIVNLQCIANSGSNPQLVESNLNKKSNRVIEKGTEDMTEISTGVRKDLIMLIDYEKGKNVADNEGRSSGLKFKSWIRG